MSEYGDYEIVQVILSKADDSILYLEHEREGKLQKGIDGIERLIRSFSYDFLSHTKWINLSIQSSLCRPCKMDPSINTIIVFRIPSKKDNETLLMSALPSVKSVQLVNLIQTKTFCQKTSQVRKLLKSSVLPN